MEHEKDVAMAEYRGR